MESTSHLFSESVLPGKYKHYKGNEYKVLSVATHSETLESMVVYQALYNKKDVWVRPIRMFLEMVMVDGEHVPRFLRLG